MNITVTAPEWGFITADVNAAVRGVITADAHAAFKGKLRGAVPGLKHDAVQCCALSTVSASSLKHLVVNAAHPALSETECNDAFAALSKLLPDAVVSFITGSAKGRADAMVPKSMRQHHHEIACAHAVWQYSGGWDESQPLAVTIGKRTLQVFHEFDGQVWQCRTAEG